MPAQDETDQLRVVEMVRSITTHQPAFQLDVPKLLLLCALEYQARDKPTMTEAEVHAALARQSKAERDALEARAKRAISAAVSAGLLGVTHLGRVGLRDQPPHSKLRLLEQPQTRGFPRGAPRC